MRRSGGGHRRIPQHRARGRDSRNGRSRRPGTRSADRCDHDGRGPDPKPHPRKHTRGRNPRIRCGIVTPNPTTRPESARSAGLSGAPPGEPVSPRIASHALRCASVAGQRTQDRSSRGASSGPSREQLAQAERAAGRGRHRGGLPRRGLGTGSDERAGGGGVRTPAALAPGRRRRGRRGLPRPPLRPPPRAHGRDRARACTGSTRRAGLHARRGRVPGAIFAPAMGRTPWPVPAIDTPAGLAAALDLHPGELAWLADRRRLERRDADPRLRNYRYRWLARPAAPPRLIEQPKRLLKETQRRLLRGILEAIPPHDAAHGFRRGHSALTHARRHTGQDVVLRFDLEDFFASIAAGRVYGVFRDGRVPGGGRHRPDRARHEQRAGGGVGGGAAVGGAGRLRGPPAPGTPAGGTPPAAGRPHLAGAREPGRISPGLPHRRARRPVRGRLLTLRRRHHPLGRAAPARRGGRRPPRGRRDRDRRGLPPEHAQVAADVPRRPPARVRHRRQRAHERRAGRLRPAAGGRAPGGGRATRSASTPPRAHTCRAASPGSRRSTRPGARSSAGSSTASQPPV